MGQDKGGQPARLRVGILPCARRTAGVPVTALETLYPRLEQGRQFGLRPTPVAARDLAHCLTQKARRMPLQTRPDELAFQPVKQQRPGGDVLEAKRLQASDGLTEGLGLRAQDEAGDQRRQIRHGRCELVEAGEEGCDGGMLTRRSY